jgi:hypothetical protein
VTRLTVVPLRTGPSQGNDKNLGRSLIAVWIPNEARVKADSGCACSQLLTIVGNHQKPGSACANDSRTKSLALSASMATEQRRLDGRKQVLAVVAIVNLSAKPSEATVDVPSRLGRIWRMAQGD